MQGAQIQPLVRELTPHMLHGTAKKKRIKVKVNRRVISPSCTPVDQLEFSSLTLEALPCKSFCCLQSQERGKLYPYSGERLPRMTPGKPVSLLCNFLMFKIVMLTVSVSEGLGEDGVSQ